MKTREMTPFFVSHKAVDCSATEQKMWDNCNCEFFSLIESWAWKVEKPHQMSNALFITETNVELVLFSVSLSIELMALQMFH